jgi:hypothetical protein
MAGAHLIRPQSANEFNGMPLEVCADRNESLAFTGEDFSVPWEEFNRFLRETGEMMKACRAGIITVSHKPLSHPPAAAYVT